MRRGHGRAVTPEARTRPPRRGGAAHRARRVRSQGAALLLVGGGALLGWVLPEWDRNLPTPGLGFDASTAQATLAAIAGGMITLAGFVVTAITLVVQTVQTMSPRLVGALGHFSRYLVLFGLLIGTALYALVALSHVHGRSVPRVSVTVAIALVLIDATVVLYLLSSLRHAVTGGGLARAVGRRLRTVIDQTCPAQASPAQASPTRASPAQARPAGRADAAQYPSPQGREGAPVIVHSGRPAVIFSIDETVLTRIAARHGVRVVLVHPVGDFIRSGETVAYLEAGGTDCGRRTVRRVTACFHYGPNRTVEQDTGYGFRLLADIAIRALSPAVNDPTTAVQALDQIEDSLLRLAGRPLGPAWLTDAKGTPRVFCPAPDWAGLLSLALDETLLYGASNPQTVRRLHALLQRLLATAPAHRQPALTERSDALDRLAAATLTDPLLKRIVARPDRQGLGGTLAADPSEP